MIVVGIEQARLTYFVIVTGELELDGSIGSLADRRYGEFLQVLGMRLRVIAIAGRARPAVS